jgi:phosphatidate cytidylyltransferase
MFLTRVLTVAVMLPLFAAALLFFPQWLWAVALLPGLYIAAWEWGGLARYSAPLRAAYAVLVTASGLALFYGGPMVSTGKAVPELWAYVLSCLFWATIAPLWLVARWKIQNSLLLGLAGWIALVPMWLALVRLQPHPYVLLMFLAVIWIADTAAYIAGKKWGRHKLAPVISPGKSWEGVAGAAVAIGVYYVALLMLVPSDERVFSAISGVALFAALLALSIVGDLFESWMKRQVGLKDSGQLLPGHGGLLDRIDGLTATMPTAALALYLQAAV